MKPKNVNFLRIVKKDFSKFKINASNVQINVWNVKIYKNALFAKINFRIYKIFVIVYPDILRMKNKFARVKLNLIYQRNNN
jgi:hypothetical protein